MGLRIKLNDLSRYPPYIRDQIRAGIAGADADGKPDTGTAAQKPHAVEKMVAPVRVRVHHVRTRAADLENLHSKPVIDGIVDSGLLPDDRPEILSEFRVTQELGPVEKTVIVIETIVE